MDPAHIFRQGLGTVPPRHNAPNQYGGHLGPRATPTSPDDMSDVDSSGGRVAHTLTACCRCRQRKTRCDPTLPRCLPCERSGSTCEYLDTARGRKINRLYVIKLQDRVRALESELSQYTDEDADYPADGEAIVRPGTMVRLSASDETPRYLGPSSGIAMTRILMEEAKRYTDSKRISELIPDVRARRQARMQSIQMTGAVFNRKKSTYPMVSEGPAENLVQRSVADKLVEIYLQKSQPFWPALHEKVFERDVDAVYNGDPDPYKNFVVRMVFAISLQKLGPQYAGLGDGYYLKAMQQVEELIQPKDLKTLQCLILIAQYSTLTPTQTPVYYAVGLAAKICQQEGLATEKTISAGYNLNVMTVDLRRRLVWCVLALELGLSHSMGRPSGFATGDDRMDVSFFSTVPDQNITEDAIIDGPPDERKLISIHFFKLRVIQAEIRRALYERKRPEPRTDIHPWYENMEKKAKDWLDTSPSSLPWCKPWFVSRFHQIKVFMYRPSPQLPKPSPRAANICFDSSATVINVSRKQLDIGAAEMTWVFLLTIYMALNTLLWSTAYSLVRQAHPREEVEELVNSALDILDRCSERWPGTSAASGLYAILSRACLLSYEAGLSSEPQSAGSYMSPPTISEPQSSPEGFPPPSIQQQAMQYLNPPQFGQVFDSPPEAMGNFAFSNEFPQPHPTFRSNSIFRNPATADANGRRFSYFPPDFNQAMEQVPEDYGAPNTNPNPSAMTNLAAPNQMTGSMPTPPESLNTGNLSNSASSTTLSMSTPLRPNTNASPSSLPVPPATNLPQAQKTPVPPSNDQQQARFAGYTSNPQQQPTQAAASQRPLPNIPTSGDWVTSAPMFMPYNFGGVMNNGWYNDAMAAGNSWDLSGAGLGLQDVGNAPDSGAPPFDYLPGRQASLTQSQQMELMSVLENEGLGDIDAFLNAGNSMTDTNWG